MKQPHLRDPRSSSTTRDGISPGFGVLDLDFADDPSLTEDERVLEAELARTVSTRAHAMVMPVSTIDVAALARTAAAATAAHRRRRATWVVAGLAAAAAIAVGAAGVSTGVLSTPVTAPPASTAPVDAKPARYLWPNPDLTITTVPHGTPAPITDWNRESSASIAEDTGQDYDRLVELSRNQEVVRAFFDQVQASYPAQFSSTSQASYDGENAWVALTGEVPPDLIPLAEALPIPIELRGGAAMSDAEHMEVQNAGIDVFTSEVQPTGMVGGLDAPSASFTISYVPDGAAKRADEATARAMADAARAALGRDIAFSAEFEPDDRDPSSTEPAVWFLPADEQLDPSATSVRVLVDQRACVNEKDPPSGLAPATVEVTDTEVRIAIAAYIRKGPQMCGGAPLTPVTVALGQPLGNRELVDVHGRVDDRNAPPNNIYGSSILVPRAG